MLAFLRRWLPRAARPGASDVGRAEEATRADVPDLPDVADVPNVRDGAPPVVDTAADLRARCRRAARDGAATALLLAGARAPGTAAPDLRALADALVARLDGDPEAAVRQLPRAAQTALARCDDPFAHFGELAALCAQDPTLAQALLRHANAAYYARAGQPPVVALRDAVARIGVAGVRAVVLDVVVHGLLCQPGAALVPLRDTVWAQLVRTAPLARLVAPACGVPAEEGYALGLLHDVGALVVLDVATALRAERRRELALAAEDVEELVRAVHEPVGGLVALGWGLGPIAARAIAAHHRRLPDVATVATVARGALGVAADGAGDDDADRRAQLLFIVDHVDRALQDGTPLDVAALWQDGALTVPQAPVLDALAPLAAAA